MLRKKRSNRNKLPIGDVNVVSLMDILTTILFFLLLLSGVSKYGVIGAAALGSGTAAPDEKKPTFTLQVKVSGQSDAEVFLGSVQGLKMVDEKRLRSFLRTRFKGNDTSGYVRKIPRSRLISDLQSTLQGIKQSFAHENKAVIEFADGVPYQRVVDVMAAVRELRPEAQAYELKNLLGHVEKTRILFPEIIISEWPNAPKEGRSPAGS